MLLLLISMGCEVSWQAAPAAWVQGQGPVLSVSAPENGAELPANSQAVLVGTVQSEQAELQISVSSDLDGDLGFASVQGQDWSLPLDLSQGDHILMDMHRPKFSGPAPSSTVAKAELVSRMCEVNWVGSGNSPWFRAVEMSQQMIVRSSLQGTSGSHCPR